MNSLPFMTNEFLLLGLMIPHSIAIARAVNKLSPVTILTLTPASLHFAIAPGTSSLKMSLMPSKANIVSSLVSTLNTPFSSLSLKSVLIITTLVFDILVGDDDGS